MKNSKSAPPLLTRRTVDRRGHRRAAPHPAASSAFTRRWPFRGLSPGQAGAEVSSTIGSRGRRAAPIVDALRFVKS